MLLLEGTLANHVKECIVGSFQPRYLPACQQLDCRRNLSKANFEASLSRNSTHLRLLKCLLHSGNTKTAARVSASKIICFGTGSPSSFFRGHSKARRKLEMHHMTKNSTQTALITRVRENDDI